MIYSNPEEETILSTILNMMIINIAMLAHTHYSNRCDINKSLLGGPDEEWKFQYVASYS